MSQRKMSPYCQKLTLFFVLLHKINLVYVENQCGPTVFHEAKGNITTKNSTFCTWTIQPPKDTITTLRIEAIKNIFPHQCLKIIGDKTVIMCDSSLSKTTFLAMRSEKVNVTTNSSSNFWLEYSTRSKDECSISDFKCQSNSQCFNASDVDKPQFICEDLSDKLGFGHCNISTVPCTLTSSKEEDRACFYLSQRCDDVIQCPRGDDEVSCSSFCPGAIKCHAENKCVSQLQICDSINDCADGYDEKHCQNAPASKTVVIVVLFLMCIICSLIFICAIFRWFFIRRDITRLLDNLPQFPLGPFVGPGDNDEDSTTNSSDIFDTDFQQGGIIYESYMDSLNKKSISKTLQVDNAKYSHLQLDGDNELVVLASLNVSLFQCKGLKVSQASITSLIENGVNKPQTSSDDYCKRPVRSCYSEETITFKDFDDRHSRSDTQVNRRHKKNRRSRKTERDEQQQRQPPFDVYSGESSQWTDLSTSNVEEEEVHPKPKVIYVKSAKQKSPEVKRHVKKRPTYPVKVLK